MIQKQNVPLSQLTTFQNEGEMPVVCIFDDMKELSEYVDGNDNFFVLGKGSNIVINPDEEFPPIVQIASTYKQPTLKGTVLEAGAGVTVNQLMNISKDDGITGLEFMAGVPASVGGMVAMNFGCWGTEVADILISAEIMKEDGSIHQMLGADLQFSYRNSLLQHEPYIVLSAKFNVGKDDPNIVKQRIHSNIQTRLDSQPLRDKTFGSTFRNPSGLYAGKLLEDYGFKGYRLGPVMFSEKHANFMVNLGGATYDDVVRLMQRVEAEIRGKRGLSLSAEVMLVSL